MSAFKSSPLSALRAVSRVARPALRLSGPIALRARTFSLLTTKHASTGIRCTGSSIGQVNCVRNYSIENPDAAPLVDFKQVKDIVTSYDPAKYVIVDVREPEEFQSGHIPHAINIPCKSSPGALGLHPDEFKLTFGFDKPDPKKTLLFYCLAGVRATMSEELAGTFDYAHRLNYAGSFQDWIANNGAIEVPKPETESAPESEAKSEEKA
jgi:rhodanese-related sulfurtransferase